MLPAKGYKAYKQHWEYQAAFDQSPWDQNKVLKLTISTDYDSNLKKLQFSDHSLKKKNGKHTLNLKFPTIIENFITLNQNHLNYWVSKIIG
tara:strand:- start:179 stop:451 length:273 start_codon:yes stop_codon:yes gene_type:complete